MNRKIFVFLFGLFLASLSWGELAAQNPVRITISVDWEGRTLDKDNLKAMRKFRKQFPEIRMVHFLNAAYFTSSKVQSETDAQKVASDIRSVLIPGDEFGLHIHGLKRLVEAAGVEFRPGPTYFGEELSSTGGSFLPQEPGHDVPISLYTEAELRKLIHFSKQKLEQYGFYGIKSFRAGGWFAAPQVREALVLEGFEVDSSKVPVQLFRGDPILAPVLNPLINKLTEVWGEAPFNSQPEWVNTKSGRLQEYPNNGGMADYVDSEKMLEVFETNLREIPSENEVFVHFGFHQESANRYLERLAKGLKQIRNAANLKGLQLKFVTLTGPNSTPAKVFSFTPTCDKAM